jgi:MSHA biogenesis protein MshP
MIRQHGFGAIAAIVILVILATLAAAIVSIGSAQQMGSAQDVMSTRAWQAARAGNEWGLYNALKGQNWPTAGATCDTATFIAPISETLDLTTEGGFHVTVYCGSSQYNEGESVPGMAQTVRVYQIKAVACPAATCPDVSAAVAGAGYVERTRVVLATN